MSVKEVAKEVVCVRACLLFFGCVEVQCEGFLWEPLFLTWRGLIGVA